MDLITPLTVEAIYPFQATNNDELCLKKGDLITVTQKDEGWWEGTLIVNGRTGWFPCNYVKEIPSGPTAATNSNNSYREIVLKDLINSERAHTTELCDLTTQFLLPLNTMEDQQRILTQNEYKQLTGNLSEIITVHQLLLKLIEAEDANKIGLEQRVGRIFLNLAAHIKNVYETYCGQHPKAVCILERYRDVLGEYMEGRGAQKPGILVLTTLLSKPFRRLEKYPAMLQELERHVEECHPDRGDIQRSITIYNELTKNCASVRRQKELELQVLTGPIRNWEGPALSNYGDIIYMGSVAMGPKHDDRYFVLFPQTLLILSVSKRLSAFIYEGHLPLSGCRVRPLSDDLLQQTFEIAAPMIEPQLIVCQTSTEAANWLQLLNDEIGRVTNPLPAVTATTNKSSKPVLENDSNWSMNYLRPLPPLLPYIMRKCDSNNTRSDIYKRLSKKSKSTFEQDRNILDLIDAVLSNTTTPQGEDLLVTLPSPSPLNAINCRKLLDLETRLKKLELNVSKLMSQLNEERTMRSALQCIVRNYLSKNCKDFDCIEWPMVQNK